MRRRVVLSLGAIALLGALGARAQQSSTTRRIGFLAVRAGPWPSDPFYAAFMRTMEELGYHEGKNVAIHWEYAGGDFEPLPGLAAKLIALNPELIVTHSTPPALALKRLTKAVPIV